MKYQLSDADIAKINKFISYYLTEGCNSTQSKYDFANHAYSGIFTTVLRLIGVKVPFRTKFNSSIDTIGEDKIRKLRADGVTVRAIAERYNVNYNCLAVALSRRGLTGKRKQ